MTCARSYRESMAEFSQLKTLELWYRSLTAEELIGACPQAPEADRQAHRKGAGEEPREEMFPKLAEKRGTST